MADPWDGDPQTIVDDARMILGIPEGSPDTDRLERCAQATIALVAFHLGYGTDPMPYPAPWPVYDATVNATVAAFRRKDIDFNVSGVLAGDGSVPMRIQNDWLQPVLYQLQPYRVSFGVA